MGNSSWTCNHLTGELIQKGRSGAGSSGNPITITFPQPFADNTYIATATVRTNQDDGRMVVNRDNQTATTFNAEVYTHANAGTGVGFDWIAIGFKP